MLDTAINPTPEQLEKLQTAIDRLLQHEPLQYILGEAHFYGYNFAVNPAVLIPRPETEELVHLIIERHKNRQALKILDVCTGSGCIALTLAKELPDARLWATDISPEALAIAAQNRQRLEVDVQLLLSDALKDPFPLADPDVVVSNPPYVLAREAAQMQPNVLNWEPHLALFVPDEDALMFYRAIAAQAHQRLNSGGWLYFEINEAYSQQIIGLMQQEGFEEVAVWQDMQGKARMAQGRRR